MKSGQLILLSFVFLFNAPGAWAQKSVTGVSNGKFGKGGFTPIECPNNTSGDAILNFRNVLIPKVTEGRYDQVTEAIGRCFPTEVPACLKDTIEYTNSKRHNSFSGGSGSNTEMPIEGLTLESEKDLPPEFLVKGSDGQIKPGLVTIPPNILELSKKKGWKSVAYKTRSTGGFDAGPNLVLIAIPGADKDVYLQISPSPEANYHQNVNEPYPVAGTDLSKGQDTLTIISVDKKANPPVGQLRRMHLDEFEKAYRWNNSTRVDGCTSCHASPLRSISPRGYLVTHAGEKRMKKEDEAIVNEINQMMVVEGLSWGKLKIQGQEVWRGRDPASHPLGWAPQNSETRTVDFIKQCAQSLTQKTYISITSDYVVDVNMSPEPKLNYDKIRSVMDCAQCHSGKIRGTLHETFSDEEVFFKIVIDKSMHPGAELTQDERFALYNCLNAERLVVADIWRKSGNWMKKTVCEDLSTSRRRRPRPSNGSAVPAAPAESGPTKSAPATK